MFSNPKHSIKTNKCLQFSKAAGYQNDIQILITFLYTTKTCVEIESLKINAIYNKRKKTTRYKPYKNHTGPIIEIYKTVMK